MIIDNRDGKSLEGTICENEDLIVVVNPGAVVNLSNSKLGKGLLIFCKIGHSFTVAAAVLIDSEVFETYDFDSCATGCHICLVIKNCSLGFNKDNLHDDVEAIKKQGWPHESIEGGVRLK